jgi:hypothetical protein
VESNDNVLQLEDKVDAVQVAQQIQKEIVSQHQARLHELNDIQNSMDEFTAINTRITTLEIDVSALQLVTINQETTINASHKTIVAMSKTVTQHQQQFASLQDQQNIENKQVTDIIVLVHKNAQINEENSKVAHHNLSELGTRLHIQQQEILAIQQYIQQSNCNDTHDPKRQKLQDNPEPLTPKTFPPEKTPTISTNKLPRSASNNTDHSGIKSTRMISSIQLPCSTTTHHQPNEHQQISAHVRLDNPNVTQTRSGKKYAKDAVIEQLHYKKGGTASKYQRKPTQRESTNTNCRSQHSIPAADNISSDSNHITRPDDDCESMDSTRISIHSTTALDMDLHQNTNDSTSIASETYYNTEATLPNDTDSVTSDNYSEIAIYESTRDIFLPSTADTNDDLSITTQPPILTPVYLEDATLPRTSIVHSLTTTGSSSATHDEENADER